MFPGDCIEELLSTQAIEKFLYLCLAVLHDFNFLCDDEAPEIHQVVNSRIHREKVGIHNWYCNSADMGTSASSEECRLRIAEVFFGKVRLTLKDRCYAHGPQVGLADRRRRVGFRFL